MKDAEINQSSIKKLGAFKRQVISIAQEDLVKAEYLEPGKLLPLIVEPSINGLNLTAWAENNRPFIETNLLKNGGILFRNFQVNGAADFENFIKALSGELLEYSYRSTPRNHVSGNIYTSTEYPAEQSIPLHNEMSYSRNWPIKIGFYCVQPAQQGGETPIADSRKVFQRIDPTIREKFRQKQVMYVRNYRHGLDLSWQNVFQTTDKSEVEHYCRNNSIEFEWYDQDSLKTRQICHAVAMHPKTGEDVWFNQAHLFHVSSLNSAVREGLFAGFNEEELPRNAYYGDGSPIETSVLDEIRDIYKQEAITFVWQTGDVLLLDNMLACHGRNPFVGLRKVLAGMAERFGK
ncbi:MAG: TauD/TfdA family dioxygenase [Symplocastrum torsivum CPER-KK1]|jgi:alpha-ketoglutarate-dependent taurine dioxygenase|uniref:TauD/TfdA family dioxygenase n=1 Tax=Symplocastrum torsivum CPER-KK1 TaxID=450513 RepID=A0A951U7R9_9CYAN|nr:TauD/TfdA family dioxygenase [Symplocastrum torsivum CPER-KK1]